MINPSSANSPQNGAKAVTIWGSDATAKVSEPMGMGETIHLPQRYEQLERNFMRTSAG